MSRRSLAFGHLVAWWLVVVASAALLLPRLSMQGSYLDGNMYACMARNLAAGVGSPWAPSFSPYFHERFFEHPPLGIQIEALVFSMFGDHFLVERVCSLVAFLAAVALVVALWRVTWRGRRDELVAWAAVPLALWLIVPLMPRMYWNNMLENPLIVFDLAALLAIRRGEDAVGVRSFSWHALAVAMLLAALLTKGPFGLFPLAAPAIRALCERRPLGRAVQLSAALTLTLALAVSMLTLYPPAGDGLWQYWDQQVWASLKGARSVDRGRLRFAVDLVSELRPPAAVAAALVLLARWRRGAWITGWLNGAATWSAIGLSASLPILLTGRYSSHYLATSMPCFVLGLAAPAAAALAILLPAGSDQIVRRWRVACKVCGSVALVVVAIICMTLYGRIGRDTSLIAWVDAVAAAAGPGAHVGIAPNIHHRWDVQIYGRRRHWLAMDDGRTRTNHDWYLARSLQLIPAGFVAYGSPLPDGAVLCRRTDRVG